MEVSKGAFAVIVPNTEESLFPKYSGWHRWLLQDACHFLGIPSYLNLPPVSLTCSFWKFSVHVLLIVQLSEAALPSASRCHWAFPVLVLMWLGLAVAWSCCALQMLMLEETKAPSEEICCLLCSTIGSYRWQSGRKEYTCEACRLWYSLFLLRNKGLLYFKIKDSSHNTTTSFRSPNKYISS